MDAAASKSEFLAPVSIYRFSIKMIRASGKKRDLWVEGV